MVVEEGKWVSMGSSMELVIESKSFTLVKEGSMLGITERSRRLISKLILGSTTVQWLAKAMEACLKEEKKDFYTTVREGSRSFIAQRYANDQAHYMAVVEYGGGGPVVGGIGYQTWII